MIATGQTIIPARRGIAFEMQKNQKLKVINTHGSQVLDTWALTLDGSTPEYMSMEHTRSAISSIYLRPGDTLVSNEFTPMLKLLEDTSPGIHDTLMCCCSPRTYERLNHRGHHDNCRDNFHSALDDLGRSLDFTPGPLNLFMNFPVNPAGEITREPPASRPGDCVLFRAEIRMLIVISACPQDITAVNGMGRQPMDAAYQIID